MLTYGGFIKIIRDVKDTGVAGQTCQERDEHLFLRCSPSIPSLPKECGPSVLVHASCTRVAATDCDRFGGNSVLLLKISYNTRNIFSINQDHYFRLE